MFGRCGTTILSHLIKDSIWRHIRHYFAENFFSKKNNILGKIVHALVAYSRYIYSYKKITWSITLKLTSTEMESKVLVFVFVFTYGFFLKV